jgi:hypothetical protein
MFFLEGTVPVRTNFNVMVLPADLFFRGGICTGDISRLVISAVLLSCFRANSAD